MTSVVTVSTEGTPLRVAFYDWQSLKIRCVFGRLIFYSFEEEEEGEEGEGGGGFIGWPGKIFDGSGFIGSGFKFCLGLNDAFPRLATLPFIIDASVYASGHVRLPCLVDEIREPQGGGGGIDTIQYLICD